MADSDEVKLVDDDAEVSTYVYGDDNLPTSLDGLCRRLDWYEKKRKLVDCLEEASAIIHAANGTENCTRKRYNNQRGQLIGSPAGLITDSMVVGFLASRVPFKEDSYYRFWDKEENVTTMRELREDSGFFDRVETAFKPEPEPKPEPAPAPSKQSVAQEILATDPLSYEAAAERAAVVITKVKAPESMLVDACALEIRSFVDIGSIGAEHYYGTLSYHLHHKDDPHEKVELEHPLTTREAKHLNKKDGSSLFGDMGVRHRKGEMSVRFETKEELRAYAIIKYRTHFPNAIGLVEGSGVEYNVSPILHGLDHIAVRAAALMAEWKACGGYEGDEERARDINKRWRELTSKPSEPTQENS